MLLSRSYMKVTQMWEQDEWRRAAVRRRKGYYI